MFGKIHHANSIAVCFDNLNGGCWWSGRVYFFALLIVGAVAAATATTATTCVVDFIRTSNKKAGW